MHINWAAFGEVFLVSFGVAVGVIVLFAIGVTLLSTAPPASPDGAHARLEPPDRAARRGVEHRARADITRRVTAWICFLACALTVAYGLSVLIAR